MSWPYQDQNRREVVTDDSRDPDTSWQHHLDRGSLGGVDHGADTGTPVYANCAGTIRNIPLADGGSGGRTVNLTAQTGWVDAYMHLSRFVLANGTVVRQGQLIGYSGSSGYGEDSYYHPHLHIHRVDPAGVRRNPWWYFAGDGITDTRYTKPGKIEYTLDSGDPNITFWRRWQWLAHQHGYQYPAFGAWMPVPAIKGIQRALAPYGYSGAVDGIETIDLSKAGQRLARKGGYSGPIDGDWGPNTYRGLSVYLNTL